VAAAAAALLAVRVDLAVAEPVAVRAIHQQQEPLIPVAVAADLEVRALVAGKPAALALLSSAIQIHIQRLPQQVVQRLPLLAVTEFTHSPDLGALLSNGTLRTG
jgi:hypothetical protein